jgi:branched-chain amino acid transport system substrate-binding protein
MNPKNNQFITLLLLILLLVFFAGCQEPAIHSSADTVKIGFLYPMTGDLTGKAQGNLKAAQMAVEEINAAGGISALGGAKMILVSKDTRFDPEVAVQETQRLIKDDGVTAIIGAFKSSVTIPVSATSERLKTPFITPTCVADIITERGFHYLFRPNIKASWIGRDEVLFLSSFKNLTGYEVNRVALIHENSDFGTSTATAQKEALKISGMEMVCEVTYNISNITDLIKEVNEVLATNPDIILETTYLNDSIMIREAMAKAGSNIPLVDSSGGTVSPDYLTRLGKLAEGTLIVNLFSDAFKEGKDLNDRYREKFGENISNSQAITYQTIIILKDALERAGSTDREKVRNALASTNLTGDQVVFPANRIQFDETGQNIFINFVAHQIQDGKKVLVWPSEFATGTIRMGDLHTT